MKASTVKILVGAGVTLVVATLSIVLPLVLDGEAQPELDLLMQLLPRVVAGELCADAVKLNDRNPSVRWQNDEGSNIILRDVAASSDACRGDGGLKLEASYAGDPVTIQCAKDAVTCTVETKHADTWNTNANALLKDDNCQSTACDSALVDASTVGCPSTDPDNCI